MGITNLNNFPNSNHNNHNKYSKMRNQARLENFISSLINDGLLNQYQTVDELSEILDTLQELPYRKDTILDYYQEWFLIENEVLKAS